MQKSRDNTVTLTWEHISVSIKNLQKNQRLRILYITRGDRVIAIAPLRSSHYKFGFIGYNVVELLDYGSATDYTGLILAEKELECLQIFMNYLFCQVDWDYLYFDNIPENSAVIDLISTSGNLLPKFDIEKGEICPYMLLPDSMDKFRSSLKYHHRKQLRRCLRNLEKDHGIVELKEFNKLGSLDEAMQVFFDLHQKRWISRNGPGAFTLSEIRDIFVDRARLFVEKGWLGLYFLTANDKPIAVNYTLKYNKKISSCSTGFDPEYHTYSVSNLLLMKILEECIQQGFTEYDFMRGEEPYKTKWTKNYRTNYGLKFVNRRPSSRILRVWLDFKKHTLDSLLAKINS